MKKVFLINRQIREPKVTKIKILTQFSGELQPSRKPSKNETIGVLTIFFEQLSYQGEIKGKNINNQLTWSELSYRTLMDCLMGKRQNMQISFNPYKQQQQDVAQFKLDCDINTGIKLNLFKIQLKNTKENSYIYMKKKFNQIQQIYHQKQTELTNIKKDLLTQKQQIQALQKEIIDSTNIEINFIKNNFIKIVNQCKQQIKKYMVKGYGPKIILQNQEQEDQEEEIKSNFQNRKVVKVNRNALQKIDKKEQSNVQQEQSQNQNKQRIQEQQKGQDDLNFPNKRNGIHEQDREYVMQFDSEKDEEFDNNNKNSEQQYLYKEKPQKIQEEWNQIFGVQQEDK